MPSLYIHIPFCRKKCFYCSFVVDIGHDHWMDPYLDCLVQEAEHYPDTEIETVYLGGGTPSYLNWGQLQKFLTALRKKFKFTSSCEWTLEANPEGLDLEKAELLYALGINRVSLGVQSLNDRYLKYLGRCHDARRAVDSFKILRQAGFRNINVDLMYSFPGQTDEQIKKDVVSLASLGSEHLSLYTLTIEENSRFHARRIKLEGNEDQARQYELVVSFFESTEFKQYEISNFALPGKESRHNLNYWQGGDYIGLGVGAHSHRAGTRFWNVSKTNVYIKKIQDRQSPVDGEEKLSAHQRLMELILFGLRMNQGVPIEEAGQKAGCVLDAARDKILDELVRQGFLFKEKGYLKTSLKGRLVLDEISRRLI